MKYTKLLIASAGLLSLLGILYLSNKGEIETSERSKTERLLESEKQIGGEVSRSLESSMKMNSRGNCIADECLAFSGLEYPVSELSSDVISALNGALEDEYKAYATYDAVIAEFGKVRPFIMIIRAEEQHISSLKALFDKYALEIPENSYIGNVDAPESIEEACSIGVEAEIANAALYNESLLPAVSDHEDITRVFVSLRDASQNNHLPAFERCSN